MWEPDHYQSGRKIFSEKAWVIRLFTQSCYKRFSILQGQEGIGRVPGPRGPKVISFLKTPLQFNDKIPFKYREEHIVLYVHDHKIIFMHYIHSSFSVATYPHQGHCRDGAYPS